MSKKAKPALIGAFVLGAFALAVAGVILFGSASFFKEQFTYVAFFDGSVKGLNVGAPVMLRGVRVGTVKEIHLDLDPDLMSIRIPVLLEYDSERMSGGDSSIKAKKYFQNYVDRGLKAQLQLQSMVTGQLMVSLDFHPWKPIGGIGTYKGYPEIPTIPTKVEELTNTLENIPFEELINSMLSTVNKIESVISSPEIIESMRSMQLVMDDVRKFLKNVDERTLPLTTSLEETAVAARLVMEQTTKTMAFVEGLIADGSAPRSEFNTALEEFSSAARSVRLLAEYLEQHPEALIRGKGERKRRE